MTSGASSLPSPPRPQIVVAVLVMRKEKILLGRRISSGADHGMFGMPGGRLEMLESFAECATRELEEETGIEVANLRPFVISNVRAFPPLHYVVISLIADWVSGEAEIREPNRCSEWGWFGLDELPSSLTPATVDAIAALRSGQIFYE